MHLFQLIIMPRAYKRKLGARQYKNYDEEHLQRCLIAVKNGLSLSKAADTFKIPRKTIFNKLKGRHTKEPGRPTIFSEEEETMFSDCIATVSEFGFPVNEIDLRHIIKSYLDGVGKTI